MSFFVPPIDQDAWTRHETERCREEEERQQMAAAESEMRQLMNEEEERQKMEDEESFQRVCEAYWAAVRAERERMRLEEEQKRKALEEIAAVITQYALGQSL